MADNPLLNDMRIENGVMRFWTGSSWATQEEIDGLYSKFVDTLAHQGKNGVLRIVPVEEGLHAPETGEG